MSSLALFVRPDGEAVGSAIVAEARRLLSSAAKDGLAVVAVGPVVACYAKSGADRAAQTDPGIWVDPQTGIVAVAAARFDNRAAIDRIIGLSPSERSDTERAVQLYLHLGAQWGSAMVGDFAIALWDPRCQVLHIIRDHVGVRPLYHSVSGPVVGVASELRTLSAVPGTFDVIDQLRLADLVSGAGTSRRRTVYELTRRLPGGHRGAFMHGHWAVERYWAPVTTPIEDTPFDDVVLRVRELMTEAVRCRLGTDQPVVAELSGGLDSSGVAGVAARLIGTEPTLAASLMCGSLVYPGLNCDESERIAITLNYLGLTGRSFDASRVYADPDLLVRQAQFSGEPGSYLFGPAHTEFRRWEAACGVRVVLSGVGGDQLFWGPSAYLADLARHGRFLTVARHLRAYGAGRPGWIWWGIKHKLVRPLLPDSALAARRRLLRITVPEQFPWLAQRARTDLATLRRSEVEAPWPDLPRGTLAEHIFSEMADPHLSWQLEAAARGSTEVGTETRYPFLDVRLVEYMARLPLDAPTPNGRFRGLQRTVFDPYLAPAVRDYRSKAEFSAAIQRATSGYAGSLYELPQLTALGLLNGAVLSGVEADNRRLVARGEPIRLAHAVGTALAVDRWAQAHAASGSLSDEPPTMVNFSPDAQP